MASAAFTINGGASLAKAQVASGATGIALALDSADGVDTVLWEVATTDDASSTGDWTIASASTNPTTIDVPSTTENAAIIRCTVNSGTYTDSLGRQQTGDLVKTAKIYVGRELICTGELTESDSTHGWAPLVNNLIVGAPYKIEQQITTADMTDLSTSQAWNLGATLPADSYVIGSYVKLATTVSGGSISNATVTIGSAADIDETLRSCSVFAAAVDGYASSWLGGFRFGRGYSSGAQLRVQLTTTGDFVSSAVAGDFTAGVILVAL